MRTSVLLPACLALVVAGLAIASPSRATPSTAWGRFPLTHYAVNTPVPVRTAGGTTFDVTVSTGGTQGVDGDYLPDTMGVAATGLAYDTLYVVGVFNGGGFSTVPTSLTFSNIHPGPAHARGLLMVGAVNGTSSPITVTSTVPGRVATWSVVGIPFALSPSNSFDIAWNTSTGQFTTSALAGNDSKCIVIDLGALGSDGDITISLNQFLNDGIDYSLGEELTGTLDVGAPVAGGLEFAAPSPNPVRGTATLGFTLPSPMHVRLAAFDLAGRRLATLADGTFGAGEQSVRWDARGAGLPDGLCFLKLETRAGTLVRRVVVLR